MKGSSEAPGECDLWLWDGGTEYEGALVRVEESGFTARVRQFRRSGTSGGSLGKRLPASCLDLQKQFLKRRFLAHLKGSMEGTLFEASVESVQISADGRFEYLLSGRFTALDEKQLESLRRMLVLPGALFQRPTG
jgi:hypothetical protein